MINQPHPGGLLREDVLAPQELIVTEAAERLGVSRVALSRVIDEKAGISTDMATRLELAGVSTARAWLAMQASYDLAQAKKYKKPRVNTLAEATA